MIIGIDARFYGPIGKGLGRYTQEITDRILELKKNSDIGSDLSFVIFLSPDNFNEFNFQDEKVVKVKLPFYWYSLAEQVKFPFYIKKYKIDLIHFPHFNIPIFCPCKFIVTVHDLILTRFPTIRATTRNRLTYFIKNLAYRFVLFIALKRSEKIITVSNFTKQDILSLFKINPNKIVLSYEGVSNLQADNDDLHQENNKNNSPDFKSLPEKYLLYVGSAYPHKNLERLLEVMSVIKKENLNISLLLVGKEDYFYKKIKNKALSLGLLSEKREVGDTVVFLGYVSDYNLDKLYSQALAFIFPSLYEGFGLPPLEAMSKLCPVLSSNQASLPEILGESVLYFNPNDSNDIVNKIKIINQDELLREKLVNSAKNWIKRYSWESCAKKTFEVYLEVLKLSSKKNDE